MVMADVNNNKDVREVRQAIMRWYFHSNAHRIVFPCIGIVPACLTKMALEDYLARYPVEVSVVWGTPFSRLVVSRSTA